MAYRQCMSEKRANYAMLTCEKFDAKKALELGLVSEVVPKEKVYERAMEIAEYLMQRPRLIRRKMVQHMRQNLRENMAKVMRKEPYYTEE